MSVPSEDVPVRPKLYVPFAVTNGVTSYSTQLLVAIAPLSSVVALVRGGRLPQFTAVSFQAGVVVNTAGPSTVPLYAYTRSLALCTVPAVTPATANRR